MIRPVGAAPSFKAIYEAKNGNFNSEQRKVMDNITAQLRSDENKNSADRTLEQQFEDAKLGFIFKPSDKGPDHVNLGLLINPKQIGTYSVASQIDYVSNTDLGDYNKDNADQLKFMLKLNRENAKKEMRSTIAVCSAGIAAMVGFLALIGLNTVLSPKNSKPVQEEVKKTITVVKDSVAKELPKDTLSLLKK